MRLYRYAVRRTIQKAHFNYVNNNNNKKIEGKNSLRLRGTLQWRRMPSNMSNCDLNIVQFHWGKSHHVSVLTMKKPKKVKRWLNITLKTSDHPETRFLPQFSEWPECRTKIRIILITYILKYIIIFIDLIFIFINRPILLIICVTIVACNERFSILYMTVG